MDEILNFILQESDEDIDLGEDDDDKSELNSDWEYEEEEEHQNVDVPTHSAVSPPPQTIRGQDSPRPFQEKMRACAINRTPNQDLHVLQVCCYGQVLI